MIMDNKKIKEWHTSGKEAYKNGSRMMLNNSHREEYDTLAKRNTLHDIYDRAYMLTPAHSERLKTKWNYTDSDIEIAHDSFKKGYEASRAWYAKYDKKFQAVIDSFAEIWEQAELLASKVDVKDIKDGFPCGSAHLYLDEYPEGEELHKALAHFSSSSTEAYKYKLPIKMPRYGQCIAYDERICDKVRTYLRSQGVFASIYSWVD